MKHLAHCQVQRTFSDEVVWELTHASDDRGYLFSSLRIGLGLYASAGMVLEKTVFLSRVTGCGCEVRCCLCWTVCDLFG